MGSTGKRRSTLCEWQVAEVSTGTYVLTGQTMNDDRFDDGTFVRTSKLVRVDFQKKEAETLNTIYSLK